MAKNGVKIPVGFDLKQLPKDIQALDRAFKEVLKPSGKAKKGGRQTNLAFEFLGSATGKEFTDIVAQGKREGTSFAPKLIEYLKQEGINLNELNGAFSEASVLVTGLVARATEMNRKTSGVLQRAKDAAKVMGLKVDWKTDKDLKIFTKDTTYEAGGYKQKYKAGDIWQIPPKLQEEFIEEVRNEKGEIEQVIKHRDVAIKEGNTLRGYAIGRDASGNLIKGFDAEGNLLDKFLPKDTATAAEIYTENEKTKEQLRQAKALQTEVRNVSKVGNSAARQLKNYEHSLTKTAEATEDAVDEAEDLDDEFQKQAANLYRLNASYTVLRNALQIIVKGVNSLVQAYAQADQAMTRFNLNFGESEGAAGRFNNQVEGVIESLSLLQGFSASGLRTVANDFYEMVRSFGVAQTEASAFTSTFVQDVAKISRATGQSLDTVAAAIQRAVATGESEAVLNQLNIDLRKTTLKSWMVEKGLITDKNAEINEGLRSLATQLYLHEAIAENENLSKNRGQAQLVAQEQIKNNLEEIKQTGGSILSTVVTPATQGVQYLTKGISMATQGIRQSPQFLKTILGLVSGITIGAVSLVTVILAGRVALKKVSILMKEVLSDQTLLWMTSSKWTWTLKNIVPYIGSAAAILSGVAMLWGGLRKETEKTNEAFGDTTNITDSIASSLDEVQKKSEDAKGSLMGFDKLNILSMGKSSVNTEAMSDIWAEQNLEIEELIENTTDYNKSTQILIGTLTALGGVISVVKKAVEQYNVHKAKSIALDEVSGKQKTEEIAKTPAEIAAKKASTGATNSDTAAQQANNAARAKGVILKNLLIYGIAGLAIAGVGFAAGAIATKSANGNFFPRASTTVIGEKYPEVAIPLGQSPQYAEMKQSIAKSVVEMLGGQAGEIKIVNQTVLDGRVIDERIRRVSRQDYKNQTGSNYKNVAMRKA